MAQRLLCYTHTSSITDDGLCVYCFCTDEFYRCQRTHNQHNIAVFYLFVLRVLMYNAVANVYHFKQVSSFIFPFLFLFFFFVICFELIDGKYA